MLLSEQKKDIYLMFFKYYEVFASATDKPLMKLERAAVTMFGIKACGSHMNGYVNHPVKGVCLWIARR